MTEVVGGAIGGIVGGGEQASASKQAAQIQANAQIQAQQLADQTQMNMYNTNVQNLKPYTDAGTSALSQIQTDMQPGGSLAQNFTLSDLTQDPGYQFDLQQGNQAVQRSAAANGTLNSGGTLKSIANYTTGLASNEINNAYNRYVTDQTNSYNRLLGVTNVGESAAGMLASNAQQTGSQIAATQAATTVGAGNATAAGTVGAANAWSQALTGASNTYTQYTSLNKLLSGLGSNSTNLSGNPSYGNMTPQQQVSNDVQSEDPSMLSQIGNWVSNQF